jgi:hypothetical protein
LLLFVPNNSHLPWTFVQELNLLDGVLGDVFLPNRQVQDQPQCRQITIDRGGHHIGGSANLEFLETASSLNFSKDASSGLVLSRYRWYVLG